MKWFPFLIGLVCSGAVVPVRGQGTGSDYERALSLAARTDRKVFRTDLEIEWLPESGKFRYRCGTGPGVYEHVVVDAAAGTRQLMPDESGLAPPAILKSSNLKPRPRPTRRTGPPCRMTFANRMVEEVEIFWFDNEGRQKSYGRIAPGAEAAQNTFEGHQWVVKDLSGKVLAALAAEKGEVRLEVDGGGRGDVEEGEGRSHADISPDGKYRIEVRDHNLFLKPIDGTDAVALTVDGTVHSSYRGEVAWSPDSTALVATRVAPGQEHPVRMVESSPEDRVEPKLFTHDYLKPGDKLPEPRPVLIEIADRKVTVIDNQWFPRFFTHEGSLDYRWQEDGRGFSFSYNQRGHQVFRVLTVDRATGSVRVVAEETSPTFIDYTQKTWHRFLNDSRELLWMSERDGWCHLYLYDGETGAVKTRVTSGPWVVRNVERMEEKERRIWFYASGLRAGEDPYHRHLCRVNFDGSGFVRLTEGDGSHEVEFSPDGEWLVDTWSRADQPPVTELRRASDGKLMMELERGDWSALLAEGWVPPERFSAKGRDGVTEIYGTIIRPSNFDPGKSYPVLEEVYAGPHGAFAAKEFTVAARQHALAELGFVVVQADGMGTNHRGKKFHDVCWKNLADAGFPDRIAWMKAAAASRPWMDLKRVGIYGGSAGGQSAMRALIDHGDFYQAAAADCGCHDNRMDKIWWNEQWMGWPVDESYARNSNVTDAHRMRGHLFLSVGEMDSNVDPASTMQVVNALVRADKDFELLVMPGSNHGAGETPYAARRRMDFFVRHLMGVEPRR